MQIVPLTGKTKLVPQVVVASCATCATAIETKYCAQIAQNSDTTSAKKTNIVHNKPKTMAQLAHKWHNYRQPLTLAMPLVPQRNEISGTSGCR